MAKRPAAKSASERPERLLTDPRAIRALAHPARLAVLEAFDDSRQFTATEAAAIAGLTPSAMSYHLRALERWGFVERAPAAADARERPWQAVDVGWRVEGIPDRAATAATNALVATMIERVRADVIAWFDRERTEPKAWREAATVQNSTTWLTVEEADELDRMYRAFLDARRDRTATDRPASARRVRVTRVLIPLSSPSVGSEG